MTQFEPMESQITHCVGKKGLDLSKTLLVGHFKANSTENNILHVQNRSAEKWEKILPIVGLGKFVEKLRKGSKR
jgi:hypothetical protein